ncbi:SAM-dependent methyltransferase [Rhodospira trueperi]|uniref:Methyltransferase domain-containing protein n=1 Tax=Rhodospira trueperi TaxID=69960 RepID=A0A1G7CEG3_9PROT|nr:class I SAM-dependent methyltransferase [Rhodospira trueperi]SDE37681.1 Methyltransferase domain-containing protein [Rhodospira trueperi]
MPEPTVFPGLADLGERPAPFSVSSARVLWTDPHISGQLLTYHLDPEGQLASRPVAVIDASVAWLGKRLDIDPETRLCDFGCGPGLYTERFAARFGARVTGVDFSPRSLAHARATAERAGLSITYHEADYLTFSTEDRFDVITLIFLDVCALSPAQRRALYGVWRRHLKSGGRIALDVVSRARFETLSEDMTAGRRFMDGFWSPGDYVGIQETFLYDAESLSLERYTIVEADDQVWTVHNWLQHFTPAQITAELEAAGFAIEDLYGDLTGAPLQPDSPVIGVIARYDGT